MVFLLKNFARSTLVAPVGALETTLEIEAEDLDQFPLLESPGDMFTLTLFDGLLDPEIVYVTAQAGSVFTILRAQEGTTEKAWLAGTAVRHGITAGSVPSLVEAGFVEQNAATEEQAGAGTSNAVLMTPQRTTDFFNARTSAASRELLLGQNQGELNGALGRHKEVFDGNGLSVTFTLSRNDYIEDYSYVLVGGEYYADGFTVTGDELELLGDPPPNGTGNVVFISGDNPESVYAIPLLDPANFGAESISVTAISRTASQLTWAQGIAFMEAIGLPVAAGVVEAFAGEDLPTGYLWAQGQNVSRTTEARLFAALGTKYGSGNGTSTFGLPDPRGEFLRYADRGRGVDSGRAIGSTQGQAIQSHTHSASTGSAGAHTHSISIGSGGAHTHGIRCGDDGGTGSFVDDVPTGNGRTNQTLSAGAHSHSASCGSAGAHTHSVTVNATGGTETRPRNIAFAAIIRR